MVSGNRELVGLDCGVCPFCGEPSSLVVTREQAERVTAWTQTGKLPIQIALRDLPTFQREQIMSGVHGDCWDRVFGDE